MNITVSDKKKIEALLYSYDDILALSYLTRTHV